MSYRYGTYKQINTIDKVGEYVSKMATEVSVFSIEKISGSTYFVSTANVRRLVVNMFLTISGTTNFDKTYRIFNIYGSGFSITEASEPENETGLSAKYTLSVTFVHGSYADMYKQLESKSKNERLHVVGLVEKFTTDVNRPPSGIYKTPSLRLIFCTPYKNNWTRSEHNDYAIKPLENLVDLFANIANIDSWRQEIAIKYGKFSLFKGAEMHLLGAVDAIEVTNANLEIEAEYYEC